MVKIYLSLQFLIFTISQFQGLSTKAVGIEEALECQFKDAKTCFWSDLNGNWKFGPNDYGSIFGKPAYTSDHLGFPGDYIFVENKSDRVAKLESQTFDLEADICFRFVYYMFGDYVGQLSLMITEFREGKGSLVKPIWRRNGSKVDDWSVGQYYFEVDEPKKVKLTFEATSENIALGPIRVNPGQCSKDFRDTCDFEDLSLCLWSIPSTWQRYKWYISNGESPKDQFIQTDTTSETKAGKFLRTPSKVQGTGTTSLESVSLSPSEARCLSFKLYRPSQNSDTVEIVSRSKISDEEIIWTSSAIDVSPNWQAVHVDLEHKSYADNFSLLIKAQRHSNSADDSIAIDDLQLDPKECQNLIDCSFARDNCNFIISGPLIVGFGRLSHPEVFSHPIYTFSDKIKDRFFLYTDTPASSEAILSTIISPVLPATKHSCLSFLYFIDFDDKESADFSFNVSVKQEDTDLMFKPKIEIAKWSSVEYTFASAIAYQIKFDMKGYKTFVAIDEVKLREGQCDQSSNRSSIIFQDNFDSKSDQWSDWSKWQMESYKSSVETLPRTNRFGEKQGQYIYLADLTGYEIETGLLVTNSHSQGLHCLSIWYWCRDYEAGQLDIEIIASNSTTRLVNVNCDDPNDWRYTEATFTTTSEYQIKIYGIAQFGGALAVDDFTIFKGPCYHDQVTVTCTFDDGTDCGVDVIFSPYYNWGVKEGNKLSTKIVDRSTKTLNGKVLALDLYPEPKFTSESYFYLANLDEDTYCLSFAYSIRGDVNLSIWRTESGNLEDLNIPLETYTGLHGPSWLPVTLQIDRFGSKMDIVFGGSYNKGFSGLIAIDDLKISRGECSKSFECDFETKCSWTYFSKDQSLNVDDDLLDQSTLSTWKYGVEAKSTEHIFPKKDHTLSSETGHYAITQFEKFSYSIMVSPVIYLASDVDSLCIKFAYKTIGNNGIEIVIELHEGTAYVAAVTDPSEEKIWAEFEQTLDLIKRNPSRMVRVYLLNRIGVKAAIDDLYVAAGQCQKIDPSQHFVCDDKKVIPLEKKCDFINDCTNGEDEFNCGQCEFDLDSCGYLPSEWRVEDGKMTLTSKEYTSIYTSFSGPKLQRTSSTCKLEFSYSIRVTENNWGRLIVSLALESREVQIWNSDFQSKSLTKKVSINMGRIDVPFKPVFYGDMTWPPTNDKIVVDYIHFVDCGYTNETDLTEYFTCSDGQRIGLNKECDLELDCRDGEDEENCKYELTNFETGDLSPWTNVDGNMDKWKVYQSNDQIKKGPTMDHSRRTKGQYAILLSSDSESDPSPLVGPVLNSAQNCTISFYYYLVSDAFSLELRVNDSKTDQILKIINDQTNFSFKKVTLTLDDQVIDPPFQFIINGVERNKDAPSAYVAIDDIALSSECYLRSQVTTPLPRKICTTNQFYCPVDDECINIKERCDYVDNCPHGEDEANCGPCNFADDNVCGWINGGDNILVPMNSSTDQKESDLPDEMFTLDSFLVAVASQVNGSAMIRSPGLGVTSSLCLFKFKYYLSGESRLTVKVENKEAYKFTNPIDHHPSDPSQWINGTLSLASLTPNQHIQLIVEIPSYDQFFAPIGLADFKLAYCDPNKVNIESFNCNFDNDLCDWKDDGDSEQIPWTLMTNSVKSKSGLGKYSNRDHGRFIVLQISSNRSNTIKTLTSPWQYVYDTLCFSFDYRLLANSDLSFELLIETPESEKRSIFMRNKESNYGWNRASVTINDLEEFRLIFKVTIGAITGDSIVFLDNFKLSTGSCADRQSSCDFSSGTCGWINEGWLLEKKQAIASADGSSRDYFLKHSDAHVASLTLTKSSGESDQCLSLWYYHETAVDSKLMIGSLENDKVTSTLAVPSHEASNSWTYYQTSVILGGNKGIKIEAEPLESFDYVGIDDLTVHSGPCDQSGSCDFEYDTCGWKNVNNSQWRRNLGVTPITDNSDIDYLDFAERGWFMFISTNDFIYGQSATLQSPLLTLISPFCLTFNYIFTSGVKSSDTKLTINTVKVNSVQEEDTLMDNGTVKWESHETTITTDIPFKILLTVTSDKGYKSEVAIDDLQFASGVCKSDQPKPTQIPVTAITIPPTTSKPTTKASTDEPDVRPTTKASTNVPDFRSTKPIPTKQPSEYPLIGNNKTASFKYVTLSVILTLIGSIGIFVMVLHYRRNRVDGQNDEPNLMTTFYASFRRIFGGNDGNESQIMEFSKLRKTSGY